MNFTEMSRSIRLATKRIEGWNSDHKADTLLAAVLWARPAKILEVGVFGGKSLCVFGLALQFLGRGHVLGLDSWSTTVAVESSADPEERQWWTDHGRVGSLDQRHAEAVQWIQRLGLGEHCSLRRCDAHEVAAEYSPRSFDLIHLDADKSHDGSLREIRAWLPNLRIGGLLVYDDCDWPTRRAAYMEARRTCRELYEHRAAGDAFAVLERER